MPDFKKAWGVQTSPFGVNEYLRSTDNIGYESFTLSALSVPFATRDGNQVRIAQPGLVLAKITSGSEIGKTGPYQNTAGTAAVQTLTASGTWGGTTGTYRLSLTGATDYVDIPVASGAAAIASALNSLLSIALLGGVVVTGGPAGTANIVVNFNNGDFGSVVPILVFSNANVVGGAAPVLTPATTTSGVAGAIDGRSVLANIVGILHTPVPWQLRDRDVEVSVVYSASVWQGWCTEMNSAGLYVPVSNATAAAMQRGGAAGKRLDISWN